MNFEEKALQNDNLDEEEFKLPEELLLNSMLLFEEEDSSFEQEMAQESEEASKADQSGALNTEESEALNKDSKDNRSETGDAGESDKKYVLELDAEKKENYYQQVKKELSMYMLKRQQITESLRYKRIFDKKTRFDEESKGFSQKFGNICEDKSEKKNILNKFKQRSERGTISKEYGRPEGHPIKRLIDIDGLRISDERPSSGLIKDFDKRRLYKRLGEEKQGYVLRKAEGFEKLGIEDEKKKKPCIDENRKKELNTGIERKREPLIDRWKELNTGIERKREPLIDRWKELNTGTERKREPLIDRWEEFYDGKERERKLFFGKVEKKELYIGEEKKKSQCNEKEKKPDIEKKKKKEDMCLITEKQTLKPSDTALFLRRAFSLDCDGFESRKDKLSLDDRHKKKYDGFSMKI